ncbi:MAG: hypothetical protein DI535_18990 [Citrobacter freundii]|nr:MAG: hypothetical protein DI535_18990 [Citrobacter freundii]
MSFILFFLLLNGHNHLKTFCDCDTIIGKKAAQHVFEGRVTAITRIDSDVVSYEVAFRVERKIKGRIKGKKMVINVPCMLEMCCGIPFTENERYVVYTFIRNGKEYTSACTLTSKLVN